MKKYPLLDNINGPEDLKKLSLRELEQLCGEVRDYMVECCAVNPGHLGASLGAVETIVALHKEFNTPRDKIVFDVGHQAYAHKILTGRRDAFRTMRRSGGISGFPKMSESPYDAFGAGHSSTSVSAALGLAEAAKIRGTKEKVVAVIGDGALTGGMAWEGLNNAGSSQADILIILNDNNISIDKGLGGVHNYLLKITTNPAYNKVKRRIWNMLGESRLRKWIQKRVTDTKSNLVRGSGGAMFEALGLRYFGPVDGNDIAVMTDVLRKIRPLQGPRILHCITRKGKGYAPAEADPTTWHAPGRFNPETGERIASVYKADRYQDVFGTVLCELARTDSRVVGITPAMASGSGMTRFAGEFPDRFFDVGIEEEHAVTFSAGLAAGGLRPFCNIYSSFSQRAYDQLIHDVALQGLPVVLCLDRAGLVGEDGATHNGVFDLAAYRSIPGARIAAPANERELKNLMYSALQENGGLYIIRYPRGCGEGVAWKETPFEIVPAGKGEKVRDGEKVAILTAGPFAGAALEAAEACRETRGFTPAVYNMRFVKPLDEGLLEEVASRFEYILTVEDGTLSGGLYGAVCEHFAPISGKVAIEGIGIPDRFITHASQKEQRARCGLDAAGILARIGAMIKK